MKITTLSFALFLSTPAFAVGELTVQALPGSPVADDPVCYDGVGTLSNCTETPLSGGMLVHLSPVVTDSTREVIGTFLGFKANLEEYYFMTREGYLSAISKKTGLIVSPTNLAYFTSVDCTGQEYFPISEFVQPGFVSLRGCVQCT